MIVCASGGLDHDEIANQVYEAFKKLPETTVRPATAPANYVGGLKIDAGKDFSQVSIGIGFRSVPVIDNSSYAHFLLAEAFGGGMSSPLFTEVREKRGLVYGTSCFTDMNTDYGTFVIYGGMTPENLNEFINVACSELAKLTENINELDLIRAKNSILVSQVTMQEKPENMIFYMARSMFQRNRIRDFDEVQKEIERMTVDDLKSAARLLLKSKPSIALVGPVPDADYEGMVKSALGEEKGV